jgi:predicted nucleic acid-binding protein
VALDYLIDTSVIFRLGTPTVRAVVEPLVAAGRVGRAGIMDLEVGYGGRNAREWDNAQNDPSVFELVETVADHFRRARQVQRMLASRSQRGRKISDLLIAGCSRASRSHRASLRRRLRHNRQSYRSTMRVGCSSGDS